MPVLGISRPDTVERVKSRERRDEELDGLSLLDYHERITLFARGSTRHWVNDSITVVDFRPLYAITIHHLQRQLAQEIQHISKGEVTDEQLENIRKLLVQYTNALRDFELIHSNRWNTYFIKDIAASRLDNGPGSKLQAALISELGLELKSQQQTIYSDDDLLGSFDHSLLQHSATVSRTRGSERHLAEQAEKRRQRLKLAWKRFIFAIVGGIAIVVPVLIIVAGTASVKTLVVVSVSIFLFALGVALFSSAVPESLLAATAAYAAVLIVFVTSSSSTGGKG